MSIHGFCGMETLSTPAQFFCWTLIDDQTRKEADQAKSLAMKDWFVIATRPAQEHRAIASLEQHKLECYRPQETIWRKVRNRRVEDRRPAIRGYVFAQLDGDDIHKLHDMEGVAYRIAVSQQAKLIAFIDWLKEQEGTTLFDHTLAEKLRRRAISGDTEHGAPLKVSGGQFGGYGATFMRMEPRGRARVMLAMFGGLVEHVIQIDHLEAA